MKREEFTAMVRKLEGAAAKDPAGYRVRIGLLAALGYGFVLLLLVGMVALIGILVLLMLLTRRMNVGAIKLVLFLGIGAFAVLRSLWVTFEKPEGIPLSRESALPLFRSVDRLTDALQAPRFHHVLLTHDFNAAVVQYPRLGIFGWQVNYLLVGLPLMQALSPEQFEGVLAHELGHLRGGHGRFGAYIYRVNATWMQLLDQLGSQGVTGILLRGFFKWYAPFFHAYSFALRRQDEYEADACAARLVGSEKYADALCLLPAQSHFVDNLYWKSIYDKHQQHPEPIDAPYTGLIHAFRASGSESGKAGLIGEALPREDAARALDEALREETGFADTHPSLIDRLKALRKEPRLPQPFAQSAAEMFFGPHLPRLSAQMDAEWRRQVTPQWRERHKAAQAEQAHLASLDQKATQLPLAPEAAWERARLTEEYRGEAAAVPLFREILERSDAVTLHAVAAFAVGRLLLRAKDPSGIAYLEQAMGMDSEAILPVLQVLYRFHKQNGDEEAANAVYNRALQQADMEEAAEEERQSARGTRYLPHGLTAEQVAAVQAQIAGFADVGEGFLVRKELVHFPEKPLYVLGVTMAGSWARLRGENDAANLTRGLATAVTALPGRAFVVVLTGSNAKLKRRLEAVEGALIYQKK